MRGRIGLWVLLTLSAGVLATLTLPRLSGFLAAAGTHTVTVSLIAAQTPADGGFNFNGYGHGGMTIVVPTGWRVVIDFQNASVLPHSALIAPSSAARSGLPPAAPVFAGAATKDVSTGLAQGATAAFSFTAGTPGTYAIVCGVPGHVAAGMWDTLVVSGSARAPSVVPANAAHLRSE